MFRASTVVVALITFLWNSEAQSFLLHSSFSRSSLHGAARSGPHENTRNVCGLRSLRCDATSPLIEATACRILKLVLRNGNEAHVSCSVQSEARDLLQGRLSGATVNGRNWASRLGLTARTVAVDVGRINLDLGALFRRRVLEFEAPLPSGRASVVFDARDFGNFLTHKLVGEARLCGRRFVFDRAGVSIDPVSRVVAFNGTWVGHRLRVELSQPSADGPLLTTVATNGRGEQGLDEAQCGVLATAMSDYFNALRVDLDGPRLGFRSLSFEGREPRNARVRLDLSIVVPKLPSIRTVAMF